MSDTHQVLTVFGALITALLLVRLVHGKRYAHGWTARFIASPAFLQTPEWRRVRYDALRANDGRCELCGRSKHRLLPGEFLNVDHIRSRKIRAGLARSHQPRRALLGRQRRQGQQV